MILRAWIPLENRKSESLPAINETLAGLLGSVIRMRIFGIRFTMSYPWMGMRTVDHEVMLELVHKLDVMLACSIAERILWYLGSCLSRDEWGY